MSSPPEAPQSNEAPAPEADLHELEANRRVNRDKIAELGLRPDGRRVDGLIPAAEAMAAFDEAADAEFKERGKEEGYEDRRPVRAVAGRVMLHRDNGKLVWLNLRDQSGDIQIAVSKRDCDEAGFGLAKALDLGDLVAAEGPLVKTNKGEVTIWASRLHPGNKSLTPPPEKWAGLTDVEARFRKRYVDLYANPDAMAAVMERSQIIRDTRDFMHTRGFVEVETPVLQHTAGGAAARPFHTHLNALDIPLTMRIAPELFLKRLLVGGMPRVFEIGKNYRNEGISKRHNPEFTSMEVYEAYGNCDTMMELTESLLRDLAQRAAERRGGDASATPFGELSIDFASPFVKITYAELFEQALGFPVSDREKAYAEAEKRGLEPEGKDPVFIVNELFEKVAEPTIDPSRPTFVTRYPAAISPLTRPCEDDPAFADRWDIFIADMEIGPAYTELNDPDVQAEKFKEQLAGADDEEQTFRAYDADFIEALKVGMPPAGGLGLGVDRIVMILTNSETIREVIAFPFMRPVE